MRRLLAPLALLLALPGLAAAGGPQVTDPSGDAPLPSYDVVALTWSADATTVRAALRLAAAPDRPARYVLSGTTPSCDALTLTWRTGAGSAVLTGCRPRHQRWYAAPRVDGTSVVFEIPRAALPPWLAAGTPLRDLGVATTTCVEAVVGAVYLPADQATSDATYVIGG